MELQGPTRSHPCGRSYLVSDPEHVWPNYPNALLSHRVRLYHDARFNLNCIALSPILIINGRRLGKGVRGMDWKKLLASITASVDEELRLRNAYRVAENRILRQQITGRVQLTDSDRQALAEMGQQLGKKALAEMATVAKPNTILAWHRTCAEWQCDRSQPPKSVGRPRIAKAIEDLVVRMARENRSWGYDRIAGALTNLGYRISDQTVGNILKRHSIPPAPERKTTVTWREFIRCHLDVLLATDFFTSEVWSWCGLAISSLLCFLHCGRGQVSSVGMTLPHHMRWIRSLLSRSLAVNAFVQRGMRVVKVSVRLRPILYVEGGLGHTVSARTFSEGGKAESQARGKGVLLFASYPSQIRDGPMRRRPRLGGLLKDDYRETA
jgi:putative transposase